MTAASASSLQAPVGAPSARAPGDPRLHPASLAWAALRAVGTRPTRVEKLQEKAKGSVYRLVGAGPGGSDVVAKRSSAERIMREHTVYAEVLPALGIAGMRYHGALEDSRERCCWLFVEDAAGDAYAPGEAGHRTLAAGWLARLHTSAIGLRGAASLPDRGPRYYLAQLHSAHELIVTCGANPALSAADGLTLKSILTHCRAIAAHWGEVERACVELPDTFVHGDFAPKNMRVRAGATGPELLPFDWGSAGWGSVAADLVQWSGRTREQWSYWANPDLDAYRAVVRDRCPSVDAALLTRLASIGKIFRCLVCIALSARSFATPWVDRAARNMRIYDAELADALSDAGWNAGDAT